MGDERTYDYAIALRAVTTTDFMTAEVTILPTETITTAANRIVNEVKNINRVMFDYTTKPPATIEFEYSRNLNRACILNVLSFNIQALSFC